MDGKNDTRMRDEHMNYENTDSRKLDSKTDRQTRKQTYGRTGGINNALNSPGENCRLFKL